MTPTREGREQLVEERTEGANWLSQGFAFVSKNVQKTSRTDFYSKTNL